MTELSSAARQVILAFADDEHLMGQQHTEWIGVAPFLEEDLAFASIGQDELGHAALLLALLVGDDDAAIDQIAFYRPAAEWRSCALTECSLGDWSDTLVRHWLYDTAEALRWALFENSSVTALSNIAVRALSEERFHRQHADALLDVLLLNNDAHTRLHASLHRLLPLGLSMFDGVALEPDAVTQGIVSAPLASLLPQWQLLVNERFGAVEWATVESHHASQRTERHGDFAPMLARMLEVLDLDRNAVW